MKSCLEGDLSPKIAAHLKNNGLVDVSARKAGMVEASDQK
jgi:predicted nuclease of predicted toxin-antitoxin system